MLQYTVSISTDNPSTLTNLVKALSKLDCRFSASDSPDPVPSAPASEPAKEQIEQIASLVIPPGLPEELQKQQPAKVKDLKEFLQRYCSYDETCHTIPQEILMALASVIGDKPRLLDYIRDDSKPNKEFKQVFNVWKKERNIVQNGQKETWLGTRSTTQTSYPIRIDIGG